jgi:hypothetical protein
MRVYNKYGMIWCVHNTLLSGYGLHNKVHTDLQVGEDDHEGQETKGDVPRRDVVLIVVTIVIMVMGSATKGSH